MKKLHLIAAAVIMSLFFTSCESDSILTELDTTIETASQNVTPPNAINEEIAISADVLQSEIDSELENRSTLIYSTSFSLNAGDWQLIRINRADMADPMSEKYRVVLTPYNGNPDLYIHGYDGTAASVWREIRKGTGTSTEITTFRQTDLMTMDRDETRIYTNVYAWTNASFRVDIFLMDVDCKEYQSADRVTTLEWNPVCGCDGMEYGNPGAARLAGVTSYTFGPCGGHSGSGSCSFGTGLGFAAICDGFESYDTGLDFAPQSYDWNVWPGGSDGRLVELAGGGPGFGGYTEKYLQIYKFAAIRSDVLLKLHGHQEDIHRVAWKMRVNSGNNAYFNIQRTEVPGEEHGEEFYFYSNGVGQITYNGSPFMTFRYPQDHWFDVELIMDLDTRIYTMAINGVPMKTWRNPYGSNGLGAIDFFAQGTNPLFDIDEVCYEEGLVNNPYFSTANGGENTESIDLELDGDFNPKHGKAQFETTDM